MALTSPRGTGDRDTWLGTPTFADEVMTWVAERVAPHKKVRAVEFVDELPKSATGKLLRRVFIQRERVAAGH